MTWSSTRPWRASSSPSSHPGGTCGQGPCREKDPTARLDAFRSSATSGCLCTAGLGFSHRNGSFCALKLTTAEVPGAARNGGSVRVLRDVPSHSAWGRGHAGKPHLAASRRPGTHWRAPPRRSGDLTACRSLARWMLPGWHPSACPGSPPVSRHPVGSRPSRRHPRVPAASGLPGRGSRSPLRRDPRSALP